MTGPNDPELRKIEQLPPGDCAPIWKGDKVVGITGPEGKCDGNCALCTWPE
ncbi:hypothetical protein [Rhodoblastus sp.]|jgi:hypothetical protein|uniref:hypothetical protein n=1 Tax=Rhodoblastus sp. TaxID=1962975 RepID=UPI0025ED045F|nr:hypothetical protein [Rhodoblastus sp.]